MYNTNYENLYLNNNKTFLNVLSCVFDDTIRKIPYKINMIGKIQNKTYNIKYFVNHDKYVINNSLILNNIKFNNNNIIVDYDDKDGIYSFDEDMMKLNIFKYNILLNEKAYFLDNFILDVFNELNDNETSYTNENNLRVTIKIVPPRIKNNLFVNGHSFTKNIFNLNLKDLNKKLCIPIKNMKQIIHDYSGKLVLDYYKESTCIPDMIMDGMNYYKPDIEVEFKKIHIKSYKYTYNIIFNVCQPSLIYDKNRKYNSVIFEEKLKKNSLYKDTIEKYILRYIQFLIDNLKTKQTRDYFKERFLNENN